MESLRYENTQIDKQELLSLILLMYADVMVSMVCISLTVNVDIFKTLHREMFINE